MEKVMYGECSLFPFCFLLAPFTYDSACFYQPIRGPAGVRAQAMDLEGNLVEDFVFDGGRGYRKPSAARQKMLHLPGQPCLWPLLKWLPRRFRSGLILSINEESTFLLVHLRTFAVVLH